MLKSFWFYFNLAPVVFGLFAFTRIKTLPPRGNFNNALEYCKEVDNIEILSEGTAQDYCIDNFMIGNFTEGFVWTFFTLVGIIFIIPLSVYVIYNSKKIK